MGVEHAHYEDVNIDDMFVDAVGLRLTYPCPCGDTFELRLDLFVAGADVAQCPTCSLTIRILASESQRALLVQKYPACVACANTVLA
jgi:diphthamide biosynthesis protein 3